MTPNITRSKELGMDFDMEPLAGDASLRSYFRLKFKGKNVFPKTMVMMKTAVPFNAEEDDFMALQSFLHKCAVPVPEIFLANPVRGIIYLEDLGDTLLADAAGSAIDGRLFELYRKALDLLLSIQTEATHRLKEAGMANPILSRKFDTAKYMEELDHTSTHFIKGYLKRSLSAGEEKRLNRIYLDIVTPIEKEPLFISHRDYHSRNLMLKDGKLVVIDFQDARMGPLHYDLASLLFDSYFELDGKMRLALLGYYIKRLGHAPGNGRSEEFIDMLYRVSLQRNLKALGTFGYQATVGDNTFYLQFVQRTVNYIKRNVIRFRELEGDAEWLASLLEL